MDVIQFQEKLRNICELGKQNGNMLTHEQIREHFASTDLETSQMLKVLQYLKLQGIMIEGDTAPVETEEVGETEPESKGTSTPLTSEEEAYLKDYLAEVSNGKEVSQEMLHTLFENLADGDAIAEAALTRRRMWCCSRFFPTRRQNVKMMLGCVFSFARESSLPLRSRHSRNSRMIVW